MERYAIIVAGGKGLRMGSELPKQFIDINGKPVLMRTLETFVAADASIKLILVLPKDHQPFWQSLCEKHHFNEPHTIASGGPTRFHSVRNGLNSVPPCVDEALVAVHDGVRPFVAPEVIDRCFAEAETYGAVVPVVEVVETLRQLDDRSAEIGLRQAASHTVNRSLYRLVQTPQTFRLSLLRKAYMQEYNELFTDDASVVETLGHDITLVEGNRENIKITTPFDLAVAKSLTSKPEA
ncbi:MAG: 2-C-methyl-D-erythritol 4-phosphate cytidylyltransferase [Bacteroidaceae bacterium]|nr:2-C-methyl-D-erythritol 4-phosphate cytidylyltransferase [Bacteroidaceae bacterium]